MGREAASTGAPPSVVPNLADYAAARASFRWSDALGELDGLPGGGLNIAYEALDRHVAHGYGDRVAVRFLTGGDARDPRSPLPVTDVTYAELADRAARFADVLTTLGVRPGDRVVALLPRVPDLYVAILGTLRVRAVLAPLFSAFGPEPVRQRVELAGARVLVTTPSLYRRKVAPWRAAVPALTHVLLVPDVGEGEVSAPGGSEATVHALDPLLAAARPRSVVPPTSPEDPALLHFTSGTTGTPKGALHVHGAVVAHAATARSVLDLHDRDVFWCTADPGWVTGTSYGVVAPLVLGVTSVVDAEEFDADRWYRVLAEQGVTVWYTAPTALRLLVRAGAGRALGHDLHRLRHVASVGEPLNPELVTWGEQVLGHPVHDTWWQTETGAIMIANFASEPIRPGSMGRPVPGIDAALVRRDEEGHPVLGPDGEPELVTDPDVEGEIALRVPWPSMFRAYLGAPDRYRRCFAGSWYLSGDLARRDADGWYWFVARGDDVIKSAGHLIGPFEVESALMEHPAVAEAGAFGVPDPVAGEVVKAYVVLRSSYEPSDSLLRELVGFARLRLGPAIAPRSIGVVADLPRTRSGKIVRRLLRAHELGLPEGDLSTLETPGQGAP